MDNNGPHSNSREVNDANRESVEFRREFDIWEGQRLSDELTRGHFSGIVSEGLLGVSLTSQMARFF